MAAGTLALAPSSSPIPRSTPARRDATAGVDIFASYVSRARFATCASSLGSRRRASSTAATDGASPARQTKQSRPELREVPLVFVGAPEALERRARLLEDGDYIE